ncbi:MAG TPA: GGDEF domain-containing protein [Persephonella sp.]|uniref:diguanylate cyclase n=1 Tax=Persephonella marina (strain DSM 14350 / EX-H1) TaxID=123214 RepID=C0QSI7_PERMH|nr:MULTISPECIES: GGDEF domain-containing protein [Persephonella]ACO03969.1 diguanylate cyclase with GAF sensor [Persephonella marina EX-H1]HCB69379.1 GGDEF domain-containing protein [Persephonella sp.]
MDKKIFKDIIKKAYENFISELVDDPYLKKFFENRSIEKIKENQIKSFLTSLDENEEELRDRYINLGKFHYSLNLPYVEFFSSIEKLQKHIIITLTKEGLATPEIITEFFIFFERIKDFSALGYLFSIIEDDRVIIKKEIEKKIKRQFQEKFIKEHLIWFFDLTSDIQNLREKPSIEIDENRCKIKELLDPENVKVLLEDSKDIEQLRFVHTTIHENAKEIYASIKKKEYLKLLEAYISLVKNVLSMISIFTVAIARENIEKSRRDPLTDLLNRTVMDMIIARTIEISKISETPFSIAMLDVDNFKRINDTYGHIVGDCVLKEIAKIIKKSLRKSDFVFRYGGEEFLVLLPSTDSKHAYRIMERTRKNIEKASIKCDSHKINVTISIGLITVYPDETLNIKQIIQKADQNLYTAKKKGKNLVIA